MRKLSTDFINDLIGGKLKSFLTCVKEDDTLSLEIRDNYINIYYRGGNIFKIKQCNTGYGVQFDKNYCNKYKDIIADIKSCEYEKWTDNIPFLKADMDAWFYKNPKLEREYQQLVLRENNCSSIANDTDYFIIDIEYANSENGSRFDLLGVKWISTASSRKNADDIRLVFIEKKYGDNALSGGAGIKKHYEDLYKFLSDKVKVKAIYEEVETIFNQKMELGLIKDVNKTIKLSENKPEFILLLANHKPVKSVLKRELKEVINSPYYNDLKQMVDMKIAKASYMGYGLYSELMVDIEVFVNEN
ncbi:MAG: hypothetical protein ACREV6_02800 [Clostridium sp.]|uniref:hypothetical protein n=1 Tax=Clostridium sp. TaxID=1506 RepID=UPI003D6D09B4